MSDAAKNPPSSPAKPVTDPHAETLPHDRSASEKLKNTVTRMQANTANDVEEDLWEGGYSAKAMVGTWILVVLVSAGLLALPVFVAAVPWMVSVGIVAGMWVIAIGVFFYRRMSINYKLTTQRFIHQVGLLSRVTDRIEVIDIDDVTFAQGPVQRIFGVGTITLTSSDRTHPNLTMLGIDEVQRVSGLIDDIRRKERRRRSLHIEQV